MAGQAIDDLNKATAVHADNNMIKGREGQRVVRLRWLSDGPARHLNVSHTSVVRFLRVILPFVALCLVALVGIWPYVQKEHLAFGIGFITGEITDHTSSAMVNPQYVGTDRFDRPYTITADLAHNLVRDTGRVDLDNPKADITLEDGTWLAVTADLGVYTRDTNTLDLSGSVNLFQDEGYEIRSEQVKVNFNAGMVQSMVPSEGQGPFGSLKSEGFKMLGTGKVVLFTGKSHLILYPDAFGDGS